MLDSYDWSERQVRRLVDRNHVPEEQVDYGPESAVVARVLCAECHQNWPCDILNALRAWTVAEVRRGRRDDATCARCGYLHQEMSSNQL